MMEELKKKTGAVGTIIVGVPSPDRGGLINVYT
jgi:hypothetical protein